MTTQKITFSSLEGIPPQTLHSVFLEAFSDYEVPMNLPPEDFAAMHARRGVSLADSVGAFEGDRLVGFIFNGIGTWQGKRCAYDAGTGIIPSHRGLGLSKSIAAETITRLRGQGYENWLLEVLVNNEKAIKTYKGAGFRETRRLRCPEGKIDDAWNRAAEVQRKTDLSAVSVNSFDPDRYAGFRDFEPSWQNSDDSVGRACKQVHTMEARDSADRILGYISFTKTGSIAQLAVDPNFRRRGVGTFLLLTLACNTPDGALRYVNVDSGDTGTLGLLGFLGIESTLDQWEMIYTL